MRDSCKSYVSDSEGLGASSFTLGSAMFALGGDPEFHNEDLDFEEEEMKEIEDIRATIDEYDAKARDSLSKAMWFLELSEKQLRLKELNERQLFEHNYIKGDL